MKCEVDLERCRGIKTENPIEYQFPLSEQDLEEILALNLASQSWVNETATQPLTEVNRRLKARFDLPYLSDDAACRLFVDSAQCVAIVIRSGIPWIRCECIFDQTHSCSFFVGEPQMGSTIPSIAYRNTETRTQVVSFLSAFAGFREDYPPMSGDVLWPRLTTDEAETEDDSLVTRHLAGWERSLCLYKSLSGDFLILRSDGQTAWAVAEEEVPRPYSQSFTEFTRRFFQHFTSAFYFDAEEECHRIEPFDPFCDKPCCRSQ